MTFDTKATRRDARTFRPVGSTVAEPRGAAPCRFRRRRKIRGARSLTLRCCSLAAIADFT